MKTVTLSQFLSEAPLPDDWDGAMYNERVPFARRVKYAQERAKRVGAGSSRIAFVIPYQGRDTVLKIAKNKKGMAQNAVEAQNLEDWYLKDMGITIPLIDYDEQNETPTWIHTELATKAKDSDFKRLTGLTLSEVIDYAEITSGRKRVRDNPYAGKVDEENEFLQSMTDFVGNYTHIPTNDLRALRNWGIYNGHPVIIDIGLDDDVASTHYSR